MATINDNYQLSSSSDINITGTEKNSTSLELESITVPVQLSGFVFDTKAGENPIANALVSVYDSSEVYVTSVYTDGTGYFSFTSLTTGSYNLIISKNGYIPSDNISTTLGEDSIEEIVVLQPYTATDHVIYGVITDSEEVGILGTRIDILGQSTTVVASTFTMADGSYSVPGLTTSSYTAVISKEGYNAKLVKSINLLNTNITNLNVQLETYIAPPEKAAISGFITDTSSNPILGAWVGLYKDPSTTNTLIATTTTTSNGYYTFTEVEPGDYVIRSKATN